MKSHMIYRTLSLLLVMCLVVSMLPTVLGANTASLKTAIANLPALKPNNQYVGYPLYEASQSNFRNLNNGTYLLITDTAYGGSHYAVNPNSTRDSGTLGASPVKVVGNAVVGADPSWAVTLGSFTGGANSSNSAAATFTVRFQDGKYLNFTAARKGISKSTNAQAITFYAHYGHGGMHLRLNGDYQMRLNTGVTTHPYFDLQKDHFSMRTDLHLYEVLTDRLNVEPLYNAIKAAEPYVKYALIPSGQYGRFLTTLDAAINLYKTHNGGAYTTTNQNAINTKARELTTALDAMPLTMKTAANAAKVTAYAEQMVAQNSYNAQSFTWDSERQKDRWRYFNGLMMDALQMVGQESYTAQFYNNVIGSDGKVSVWNDGHIDSIEPARALLDLLDTSYSAKFKKTIAYAMGELDHQITYANCGGNFTHQQGLYNGAQTVSPNTSYCWHYWTIALDGLYMALPFLMECAREMDKGTLTISGKTASGIRNDVYERLLWVADYMYNGNNKLYYHAWSSSDFKGNDKYWTRGSGWLAMTLVDVIELMPQGIEKENLKVQLFKLFDGMLAYQDATTGMWYNMTAFNRSLTSGSAFTRSYTIDGATFSNVDTHVNDLETSGTAMMAYAMLKAYNNGWVGKKYADAGLKAFNGTVDTYMRGVEGDYAIDGSYKAGWAQASNELYLYSTYESNEAKGTAPLIMAAVMAKETKTRFEGGRGQITGNTPIVIHKDNQPNYSGIQLTVSYADGSSKTFTTANGLSIPTPDTTKPGNYTITISYEGISYGTVTVTVLDAGHTYSYTNVNETSHKLTCPCGFSQTEAHSFRCQVSKAPTTTAVGALTGSCSKCSASTTMTLPKLNATDYTKTVLQAASCTAAGTDSYKWKTTTYGSFAFTATTAPLGHSYTAKVTASTCTAQGYTTYTCSRCSHSYKDNYTGATGHSYNSGTITTRPTCTAAGIKTYTCTVCKATKTEAVDPTGHTEVVDGAISPTCTESGKTEGTHCSVCQTVLLAQQTIPATGHTYSYVCLDDETHIVTCENCSLFDMGSHTYVNGTCPCGQLFIQEPVEDATLTLNHSLNLASDISVNLLVSKTLLEGFDMNTVYIESTVDCYEGNQHTGTSTLRVEPVLNGNYYYFTLNGLTAVQMNDRVSSVIYGTKNGQPYCSPVDEYSIASYAYSQLNNPDRPEALKTLCADLLRYGAKAQIFKSYRTDALADANMTDAHKAYLSDMEAVTFGNTNKVLNDIDNAPITWAGKALDLESKVALKFVFNPANYKGDPSALTLKVSYTDINGSPKSLSIKDPELYNPDMGLYVFTLDALLAAELRAVVSVQVFAGDMPVSCTLQYSADTYGNNKVGTLGDLCKALFAYSDSAKAFFGQ